MLFTALDKTEYLDTSGQALDVAALIASIQETVRATPQIDALLDWEQSALGAASETVAEVVELAERAAAGGALGDEVGRILSNLGMGAVGKKRAPNDWYRSVNEGLLPVLADRIGVLPADQRKSGIWDRALAGTKCRSALSGEEAARLNRVLNTAPLLAGRGAERGAVIRLPDDLGGQGFEPTFDLREDETARKGFFCSDQCTESEREVELGTGADTSGL